YHRGSMALMGQSAPPRPARIEKAEDLPLYEFDFDLCQKEGLSIVGDPDHVVREIRAQARELGVGVLVGLFQFGSMPHALAVKNIRIFAGTVLHVPKRDLAARAVMIHAGPYQDHERPAAVHISADAQPHNRSIHLPVP